MISLILWAQLLRFSCIRMVVFLGFLKPHDMSLPTVLIIIIIIIIIIITIITIIIIIIIIIIISCGNRTEWSPIRSVIILDDGNDEILIL